MENNTLVLDFIEDTFDLEMESVVDTGGTKNYNQLINKPKLNGVEIIGNINETDPTVPEWAKQDTKPEYTADEVGAVDANNTISFKDIKDIWDSVFKE